MPETVTAVIMLGASGPTPPEHLMHEARRRAAMATVKVLANLNHVAKILVASPRSERAAWNARQDSPIISTNILWEPDPPGQEFHFGKRLSKIVQEHGLERMLYIGGGSMPLLSASKLSEVVIHLSQASGRQAITNNLYSSDWLGMTDASALVRFAAHLPRDNMLGWVLRERANFAIKVLPSSAATRLDIDTPTDLMALRWHPDTPSSLRSYLIEQLPEPPLSRWQAAARVVDTPGSRVALIGRVAPNVWKTLQYNTQVWIRVFSEEQGMTSSGRWGGGRVQSLLADYMDHAGPEIVFKNLAGMVDAVFFDTRVYLAHGGKWPSAADRYASDLGQPEQIVDPRLRRFTKAALDSQTPIVLGAFGTVSGGLYALVETLRTGSDWLSAEV